MSIQPLEFLWIVVNVTALLFTTASLVDARADQIAVVDLGSRRRNQARLVIVAGNIRREGLRLVAQALLLLIVLPGLFADDEIPLSYFVIILIAVPVVLLISTVADARDRRKLARILIADVKESS